MNDFDQEEEDTGNPNHLFNNSLYGPNQMRCLRLLGSSFSPMKETMMTFVIANKQVLKKFRLTGTNSTMTMLKSIFAGDDSVVFGPSYEHQGEFRLNLIIISFILIDAKSQHLTSF
mmetsp:Transcript_3736/g.8325  ORF Transcript_3736/g.8325 Transcript_3736/m.8325 type:complete len:116 (+) Transcript_3736:161-508(+)